MPTAARERQAGAPKRRARVKLAPLPETVRPAPPLHTSTLQYGELPLLREVAADKLPMPFRLIDAVLRAEVLDPVFNYVILKEESRHRLTLPPLGPTLDGQCASAEAVLRSSTQPPRFFLRRDEGIEGPLGSDQPRFQPLSTRERLYAAGTVYFCGELAAQLFATVGGEPEELIFTQCLFGFAEGNVLGRLPLAFAPTRIVASAACDKVALMDTEGMARVYKLRTDAAPPPGEAGGVAELGCLPHASVTFLRKDVLAFTTGEQFLRIYEEPAGDAVPDRAAEGVAQAEALPARHLVEKRLHVFVQKIVEARVSWSLSHVAVLLLGNVLHLIDLEADAVTAELDLSAQPCFFAALADGVLAIDARGALRHFCRESGEDLKEKTVALCPYVPVLRESLTAFLGRPLCAAVAPSGRWAAILLSNSRVAVYDLRAGKLAARFGLRLRREWKGRAPAAMAVEDEAVVLDFREGGVACFRLPYVA